MGKRHRLIHVAAACLAAVVFCGPSAAAGDAIAVTEPLRQRAVSVLRDALANEERWVKVHAAEALLALDYRENVRETFQKEFEQHGSVAEYRIGIWRVLARADRHFEKVHQQWVDRIARF